MEPLILKDKNVFPTNEVIADVLKASFPAFEEFSAIGRSRRSDTRVELLQRREGLVMQSPVEKEKPCLAGRLPKLFQSHFLLHGKTPGPYRRNGNYGKYQRRILPGQTQRKLIPMTVAITEKEQVKDALSMILFKKGLK